MPTTPTSIVNRVMGVEAFTDALSLPAGTTLGGRTYDAANLFVAVPAATTTLTLAPATHSGKTILIASTGGLAVTPPAATGTGNQYQFLCTATLSGGSFTVDAKAGNASDVFAGIAWHLLTGGTTQSAFPTASNSNLFTWNGTTTGGVKGSIVTFLDVATNLWFVNAEALQSSTSATPFSNH